MIALIQRVTQAAVHIEDRPRAEINAGLLALIGIEKQDDQLLADKLLKKILAYRVFPDDTGKMNRSLAQVGGGLLLVPQFTLVADTRKGNRPGFSNGAPPAMGEKLFAYFVQQAKQQHQTVRCGVFGADMQVSLTNDGPVTFWLQSRHGQK